MPVTINGTTGIAGVDGSNTTPAIKGGTSTGTGVFYGTNTVSLATGGSTAVTVDSSQNVGIGTSSPTDSGGYGKALDVAGTNGSAIYAGQANGVGARALFAAYNSAGTTFATIGTLAGGGYVSFLSAGAERARIDTSGNFLVNTTSGSESAGIGIKLIPAGEIAVVQSASTSAGTAFAAYSTGASAYRFYVSMDGVIHATTTSISAISDVSLKENIKPLETGLNEILSLQPRRFDWKNGDGANVAGFIAQELENILPDLVTESKYNETETKKAIRMGDIMPTVVKAIQELSAKLDAAEARIAALEAK